MCISPGRQKQSEKLHKCGEQNWMNESVVWTVKQCETSIVGDSEKGVD